MNTYLGKQLLVTFDPNAYCHLTTFKCNVIIHFESKCFLACCRNTEKVSAMYYSYNCYHYVYWKLGLGLSAADLGL